MPTPKTNNKHPISWDTIRERLWKNLAYNEIEARKTGSVVRNTGKLADLEPVKSLTDEELDRMLRTGKGREGFEVEHERIPQRAVELFENAGIPADEARCLAHFGDPSNLEPMPRELHAAVDEAAANPKYGKRNPTLPEHGSLDDRLEYPLGSMKEAEFEDLFDAIGDLNKLKRTPGGRRLLGELRKENARRGGKWNIPE